MLLTEITVNSELVTATSNHPFSFIQTFGRELLRVRDSVAEESSSLEDPQLAVELNRLQRQYQMATKNVQHAVDVEAREGRPINKAVKMLKQAPIYFHTKPDKFPELVQKLQAL